MKKSIKFVVFLTVFTFAVGFSGVNIASAKANKGKATAKKVVMQKRVETKKVIQEKTNTVKNEGNKYAKGKDKKILPPVIKQGRLLIPVNAISKSLGAEVKYNQEEGNITITKDGVTIVIDLKTMTAVVGDKEFKLNEISDKNSNGRIVPIQFIAEQLGVKLSDEDEKDIVDSTIDQTTNTESTATDQTTNTGSETTDEITNTAGTTTNDTTQESTNGQTNQEVSGAESVITE